MFKDNKKAISELTSFVFLTFLVVVTSTSAYLVTKGYIEDEAGRIDRDKVEIYMKELKTELDTLKRFSNSTTSLNIDFKTGSLGFVDNQVYYISQVEFEGAPYCIDGFCYESQDSNEKISFNLSSGYTFVSNETFIGDYYVFTFKNIKNDNKFQVSFRQ